MMSCLKDYTLKSIRSCLAPNIKLLKISYVNMYLDRKLKMKMNLLNPFVIFAQKICQ